MPVFSVEAVELVAADEAGVGPLDLDDLYVLPADHAVAEAWVQRCHTQGRSAPRSTSTLPAEGRRVLMLHALSPCHSDAEATALVQQVFEALRALAVTHRDRPLTLFVVQNLGGDFGLTSDPGPRAILGAVAGLAKSAAKEWPHAAVHVLDLPASDDSAELAATLDRALAQGTRQIETGFCGGRVYVPRLVPARRRSSAARTLAPGDVWLVSGGARGVTTACLRALVQRTPLRLALLGRTPIDSPEPAAARGRTTDFELKRALLEDAAARGVKLTPLELQHQVARILAAREARLSCEELRRLGAEVAYFAVDIADGAAVQRTVDAVRSQWGPIRGVMHAAGVLADKALHAKTDAQFVSVYRTKVEGFHALLAATQRDPLNTLVCFSSVAARVGNAGQADYAAANEALNKLCQTEQHRRGANCLVRSINWGPWDGGMVGPALKVHFAAMGVSLIPVAAGAAVFADLVTGVLSTTVECVVGAVLPSEANDGAAVTPSNGVRP